MRTRRKVKESRDDREKAAKWMRKAAWMEVRKSREAGRKGG